jgi:CRISPR-associated protein Cmr3
LKPVAVAIKGYDTIGGFDYAAHADKPSRRYVPAGSVYYFDSENQEVNISAPFTEAMGQIGFGQVMVTKW